MDILKKIDNDFSGLTLTEKLDYWFENVFPEITDIYGRKDHRLSYKYFGYFELIDTELGFIPVLIFNKHFAQCKYTSDIFPGVLVENSEYMNFMAKREAKLQFIEQRKFVSEDYEKHGKDYLTKLLAQKDRELKFWNRYEESQVDRTTLRNRHYLQNHLIPFLKKLKWENEHIHFKFLDKIVNSTEKTFIINALEDLGITKKGKYIPGLRNKSPLRGFAEAYMDCINKNVSLTNFIELLAREIEMPLPARLKVSDSSDDMVKKTKSYLKKYHS